VLVLAGGAEVSQFSEPAELPLKRIRGQITRLPATPGSAALQTVVCAEGYVAPAMAGEHTLGASFRFDSDSLEPSAEENRETSACWKRFPPSWRSASTPTSSTPPGCTAAPGSAAPARTTCHW